MSETGSKLRWVDRMENGLVLFFEDGQCALFSSELLHRLIAQAEPLPTEEEDLSWLSGMSCAGAD